MIQWHRLEHCSLIRSNAIRCNSIGLMCRTVWVYTLACSTLRTPARHMIIQRMGRQSRLASAHSLNCIVMYPSEISFYRNSYNRKSQMIFYNLSWQVTDIIVSTQTNELNSHDESKANNKHRALNLPRTMFSVFLFVFLFNFFFFFGSVFFFFYFILLFLLDMLNIDYLQSRSAN